MDVQVLLQAMAEATGRVLWTVSPEGELEGDSPSWRAFTGQSLAEARGRGWLEAIHSDDRAELDRAWEQARLAAHAFEVEHRVRRPSGHHTRACLHGVPIASGEGVAARWVMTFREVWADESVRRSEERLRRVTEAAHVAVWEYDFVAGQMTRSENHDGLYGLPPQEVWTYDIFTRAAHPEDRALADQTVQASLVPGGPDDYAFDFRVIWPDGSIHWLAVSGQVCARDAEGRAKLVRGALIDVTRLKTVEGELREAVRVRDEFLQIASHELNTPLTPLLLKLDYLQHLARTRRMETDEAQRHLAIARGQVVRIAGLIRDLLDVTRLSKGKLQLSVKAVSLPALVREVAQYLDAEAQRNGCELRLRLPEEVVGYWDRDRITQVIENLVGNAIKYGRGAPVEISVRTTPGRARLEVRDHGVGISPEALPHIFDKFERGSVEQDRRGLGLGLFIVRQIVENHGGAVAATSTLTEGTTVIVELPLEGPPTGMAERAPFE